VALCACGALAANNCVPMRLRGGQAIGQIGNMLRSAKVGSFKSSTAAAEECLRIKGGAGDAAITQEITDLMKGEKLSESAIKAFLQAYNALVSGESGMILESSITPASGLPTMDDMSDAPADKIKTLLEQTVVLKLNGGLGTGMGLEQAKSLLPVKGKDTFLDFIAKQVMSFRKTSGMVRSMFMNSFSTSADTKAALKDYPELIKEDWEVVQNKVPKIDQETLKPAKWPAAPVKEWCPPGHGDLYPSLAGSGVLKSLLDKGIKYMFVSNSDNLGATLDLKLLNFFAESGKSFVMEVATRTAADKKGGHLAIRASDGRMLLRESAQCAAEDEKEFQNTEKHQYFNTNNLWIRLDKLQEVLDANDGVVPLPMIKNEKTVDPGDGASAKVFQLETAMGAAIESFEGAGAIVVGRERFAPVKTCADLLRVRSDAYVVTDDFRLVLAPECKGTPPNVDLDSKIYKKVAGLDQLQEAGVPSLKECKKLSIKGKVKLSADTVFKGEVTITNPTDEWVTLKSGTYENAEIDVTKQ
jgi:UDP-N-acetylglucosamine pyrophosphorylase